MIKIKDVPTIEKSGNKTDDQSAQDGCDNHPKLFPICVFIHFRPLGVSWEVPATIYIKTPIYRNHRFTAGFPFRQIPR